MASAGVIACSGARSSPERVFRVTIAHIEKNGFVDSGIEPRESEFPGGRNPSSSSARTADFEAGDVGYVQQTLPHYIENTGNTDLRFLEMFKSSFYQDLSLSEWLSHTPPELVMAHLNIDKARLDALPKEKLVIVPR